jgi:hypothetical protein
VNAAVAGEYFAANAWYVFVRISFCCVFEPSTQELLHGEEDKEKESEEEEVILRLGVATLSATHEIGGWTYPAAFCLRDIHFDGHLGLSPISALIRPISASSLALSAASGSYCPQAAKASVKTRLPVRPFCTATMARSPSV